jgi:hypothetical protein
MNQSEDTAAVHVPGHKDRSIDVSKVAYQLPQPTGMIPDTFVAAALDLDANEREWVPQSADVSFRPLILNVSQGYYINICAFALLECFRGIVTAARFMPLRYAAGAVSRTRLGGIRWGLCVRATRRDAYPRSS